MEVPRKDDLLVTLVMLGQRWNEPGQGKELADLLDCWSNAVFSAALNVSFSLLLPLQFSHPLFPSTLLHPMVSLFSFPPLTKPEVFQMYPRG